MELMKAKSSKLDSFITAGNSVEGLPIKTHGELRIDWSGHGNVLTVGSNVTA